MKTLHWVILALVAIVALPFVFMTSTAGWMILWFAVAIVVLLVILYNRLVNLRQVAAQAWSDILVQLQQRHDLVPNLVNVVRAYADHERGTLEAVVQARNAAVAATAPAARVGAENALGGALRQVLALAESYPQL